MIVKLTKNSDPLATATFTWSEDCQDCDLLAIAIEDDELDAIIAAKGHQGAAVEGYTVDIKWA